MVSTGWICILDKLSKKTTQKIRLYYYVMLNIKYSFDYRRFHSCLIRFKSDHSFKQRFNWAIGRKSQHLARYNIYIYILLLLLLYI